MTINRIPQSREELRRTIAERIGLEPDDIGDDHSLFELGLDSVTALSLIGSWRRAGLDRPPHDFIDAPTLGDWWRLVAAR
ncbi:acyl carrier protein [Streptomyces sp. Tu 3180]|uniref:acyl carrier protein n=1 Tax=Streptomyces sp. Tu 3180 TaxID=2682611 RepID=UPI0013594BA9|nr:acyl carrier protein [Streptomyces sp. Tu 3180]KAF3468929.1 acyl carrier protein [Streptomyces sp. Tu 3180]